MTTGAGSSGAHLQEDGHARDSARDTCNSDCRDKLLQGQETRRVQGMNGKFRRQPN